MFLIVTLSSSINNRVTAKAGQSLLSGQRDVPKYSSMRGLNIDYHKISPLGLLFTKLEAGV